MRSMSTILATLPLVTFCTLAVADEMGIIRKLSESKFESLPQMPTCIKAAVQSGDPSKGAAILAFRAPAGCTVPRHWHTPTENVMVVRGSVKMTMIGGAAKTVGPGGYAMMPSKHQHVFTCITACVGFVSADGAFDLHYVDEAGKEIAAEAAFAKTPR